MWKLAAPSFVMLLLAGCGGPEEKLSPLPQAAKPAAATAAVEKPAPPELDAAAPEDDRPAAAEEEQPFAPPYPDRESLFQPPAMEVVHQTLKHRDTDAPTVGMAKVKLRGFVRVKETKVLLEIDGRLHALPPGTNQDGIRVLKIAPPRVTLRRGEQEFTLDLTNEGS